MLMHWYVRIECDCSIFVVWITFFSQKTIALCSFSLSSSPHIAPHTVPAPNWFTQNRLHHFVLECCERSIRYRYNCRSVRFAFLFLVARYIQLVFFVFIRRARFNFTKIYFFDFFPVSFVLTSNSTFRMSYSSFDTVLK